MTGALDVARDELAHARACADVVALICDEPSPPVLTADALVAPTRADDLVDATLVLTMEAFCIGETVAVRLFNAMRAGSSIAIVTDVLGRIVADEPSHAALGWSALDWFIEHLGRDRVAAIARTQLPARIEERSAMYGDADPLDHLASVSDDERAWGLIAASDYAALTRRALERDVLRRFARRGITL